MLVTCDLGNTPHDPSMQDEPCKNPKPVLAPVVNIEATRRKQRPMYSGLLKYFPDALMEVAHVSFVGNEQHNPGQPLHWDRSKSTDEPDALLRHLKDAGTLDTDGTRHSAKVAWRALAMLQKELEAINDEGYISMEEVLGTKI